MYEYINVFAHGVEVSAELLDMPLYTIPARVYDRECNGWPGYGSDIRIGAINQVQQVITDENRSDTVSQTWVILRPICILAHGTLYFHPSNRLDRLVRTRWQWRAYGYTGCSRHQHKKTTDSDYILDSPSRCVEQTDTTEHSTNSYIHKNTVINI